MKAAKRLTLLLLILAVTLTASACSLTPSGGNGGGNSNEVYDISNEHFTLISTSLENYNDGAAVRVAFTTDISIFSHTASITLYDEGGTALLEKEISEQFYYNAYDTISHYIELDSPDAFSYAEVSACGKSNDNPAALSAKKPPRVTFYIENEIWARAAAKEKEQILSPDIPTRDNFYFLGWYADKSLTEPFDFSAAYTSDTAAYAKFAPRADELTNKITTEIIPSIVTIRTTYYKYQGFQQISQGATSSGFVISHNDTLFVMTNCHSVVLVLL